LKATGIIRQIDDLGRIVIPKELRRSMRIHERDPFEIFTDNDGSIILRKYTPNDLHFISRGVANTLCKRLKCPVLICDMHTVLEVVGDDALSKDLHGRKISEALYENCLAVLEGKPMRDAFSPIEYRNDIQTFQSAPIVTDSREVIGSLSLLGDDSSKIWADDLIRFQMAVNIVGDQYE
jgi:AbrB family transcriptional regulator (stage V sporulation protein T)